MSGSSANKIQIKRSTTNAVVTGLSNGELAFTQASNVLFIGLPDGSGVAPIGGVRYPGTLTANQALVANSSSAIDKVIVANAVITYVTANGALGTANQVLSSNSSGGVYWRDAGSLGTNADAQYTWTNTQTFSNTITFSSTINGSINGNANNAAYLGGTAASSYATQSYVTSQGYITSAALSGYATESYVTSQGFLANIAGSGNVAYDSSRLGGTTAANFVQNTDSRTLSGNLYLTGANTGFSTGYFVGGQPGAAANSVSANSTAILIGNSIVSSVVNSTSFSGTANNSSNLNGKSEANLNVNSAVSATNANNATYLNGSAASDYQTTAGLSANVATLTSNNSTYAYGKTEGNLNVNSAASALSANNSAYLGGTAASGYQTTAGLSANVATLAANSATYLGGNTAADLNTYASDKAANAYSNAMSDTLSRNGTYTGNNVFSGANNRFTGTNTTVTGFLTTANADLASVKVRTSKLIGGSYDRNEVDLSAGDKLIISGGNYGLDLRSSNNGSDWFTLNLNANTGALVPSTNGTMNLGTTTNRFGTLYLSGSTITLGNTTLSDEDVGGLTVTNMNVTSTFTSSGNTKLGDSTADVIALNGRVNTSIVPSANITYNLGTIDLRYDKVFGSNVVSEYINVGKDLTVSGNLYVTGTVAYINTTSFSTTDTLIQLASNNNVTDILDIGFFGEYSESSTVKYTGLFRDASDGTYALFTGLTDLPLGTVNTAAGSYGYASLKTYITSSALVANATQTNITANSSVSVSLTANTLNFDKIDAGTF